jgi:Uma2 family endonuclease
MTTTPDNNFSIALLARDISGPKQGQWTYDDYAALPDDGRRYEVMNGVLIMAPAPTPEHQGISTLLLVHLFQYSQAIGLGKIFTAPLDVELTTKRVVQPDILVVLNANLHKIAEKRFIGAPDLVVEIASPGTEIYDRLNKYEAYEQAGVPEYWMVNPTDKSIEVSVLEHGVFELLGVFQGQDTIPSGVVPGIINVQVKQFFGQD